MTINFHLMQYFLLERADLISNIYIFSHFMMISSVPNKILRI